MTRHAKKTHASFYEGAVGGTGAGGKVRARYVSTPSNHGQPPLTRPARTTRYINTFTHLSCLFE